MRCGILTLRQGNVLRAEPYNPHRLVVDQLLTFKEQQLPDQERVGSRSPPPPEPTYGPIPEQGQPPRSSQHRKGHQPANPDHERKGRFSTRQPACIPHQGGKKKSHHFFSTVLGSTDGDSKYEGPPNSTGSLTFKFKSQPKTKAKEAPADPKDKEKGKAAEQPVESISSDKEMISALRHGMRGN
ncbi:hypothetical protein VitviT2T_014493 [Vitis vinifera]|uniref:Uncharacterized protein n=1 Tax=Vitis vinifera TaxID=29760 RepID=A0ABY9CP13_VITVI|nr:hypothetical protein VitviT2T_014493 [Vitis vinifera]